MSHEHQRTFKVMITNISKDDKDVFWGNNANELNASYAADGYARINGVGVSNFSIYQSISVQK
jgi:TPP-dependent 2-oxoacid decarboxylase